MPTLVGVAANELAPGLVRRVRPVLPLLGVALTTLLCASPVAQVADLLRWAVLPTPHDSHLVSGASVGEGGAACGRAGTEATWFGVKQVLASCCRSWCRGPALTLVALLRCPVLTHSSSSLHQYPASVR